MAELTLYIGNKNYSSWSLRPWLAMSVLGIPFEEQLIPLFTPEWPDAIAKVSPTMKVPVLKHARDDGDLTVWESLSILEYLAAEFPEKNLWPADARARSVARSISAEMHGGFFAVRGNMPMNIRKWLPGKGRGTGDEAKRVQADIRRIEEIWTECRTLFGAGGPFLFGDFSYADAMFAPVVSRFRTYAVDVNYVASEYMDTILTLPAMLQWTHAAREEPWVIEEDEVA